MFELDTLKQSGDWFFDGNANQEVTNVIVFGESFEWRNLETTAHQFLRHWTWPWLQDVSRTGRGE